MCREKCCENCPHWEPRNWYGGGYCWLDVIEPIPTTKFGFFWALFKNLFTLLGIIALFLFFPAIVLIFG